MAEMGNYFIEKLGKTTIELTKKIIATNSLKEIVDEEASAKAMMDELYRICSQFEEYLIQCDLFTALEERCFKADIVMNENTTLHCDFLADGEFYIIFYNKAFANAATHPLLYCPALAMESTLRKNMKEKGLEFFVEKRKISLDVTWEGKAYYHCDEKREQAKEMLDEIWGINANLPYNRETYIMESLEKSINTALLNKMNQNRAAGLLMTEEPEMPGEEEERDEL